jgi:hypothetical protein
MKTYFNHECFSYSGYFACYVMLNNHHILSCTSLFLPLHNYRIRIITEFPQSTGSLHCMHTKIYFRLEMIGIIATGQMSRTTETQTKSICPPAALYHWSFMAGRYIEKSTLLYQIIWYLLWGDRQSETRTYSEPLKACVSATVWTLTPLRHRRISQNYFVLVERCCSERYYGAVSVIFIDGFTKSLLYLHIQVHADFFRYGLKCVPVPYNKACIVYIKNE